MFSFDPANYGPVVATLLAKTDLCLLGPGRPDRERYRDLDHVTESEIVADVQDRDMARCCLSALWLRHNYLAESHEISQAIGSSSGSYWHGIMHRREPDYPNSKYWYRRVGDHATYPSLLVTAQGLAAKHELSAEAEALVTGRSWDPYRFVDLCASLAAGASSSDELFARQVATAEWEILFDYCYRASSSIA